MESKIGHCANQYVNNNFYNYLHIFTDGSKDQNDHVGAGVYIPKFKMYIGKRIPDKLSVYTAEMMAVIFGLQWVEETRQGGAV